MKWLAQRSYEWKPVSMHDVSVEIKTANESAESKT